MTVRVLWLINGLGPGARSGSSWEQAHQSDRREFRYEVAYALDWKQRLVPELESLGVTTHSLGVRSVTDPRWAVRLGALLHRGQFDVVHAHSPIVAAAARVEVRAQRRARRPAFVYTEHNRWPSYRVETRLANRLTFGLNDAVFAVSKDVRDSVSSHFRDAVEVVVHGGDVERVRAHLAERDAVRAELGDRFTLLGYRDDATRSSPPPTSS